MKTTRILYWIFTGIFSSFMLGSALPDIVSADIAVKGFTEIGLPVYLLPFLGIAKLLGVIAILIQGFQKIKEWAYAGLLFDLLGAVYCIAASGKPAENWAPVFIPIVFGVLSYVYYHKKIKTATQQPPILQPA